MVDSGLVGATRARLGRVGVWIGALGTAAPEAERRAVRGIESLGYGSLFCGERLGGKEVFSHLGVLLAASSHIVVGAGIANLWARHPATMRAGGLVLASAYPGRFLLGTGVSHAASVERNGMSYRRPLDCMARYLDGMDVAAATTSEAAETPVPHVLAALGPEMLALARERTDGAHPYLVPPEHTELARRILGPDRLLLPEQAVVLGADPERSRCAAREHVSAYLKLPNYAKNLIRLGFGDEDLQGGGSERLVDALVARGDAERIAERVRQHIDAGADHVLVQPLGTLDEAMSQLDALAPALVGLPAGPY